MINKLNFNSYNKFIENKAYDAIVEEKNTSVIIHFLSKI